MSRSPERGARDARRRLRAVLLLLSALGAPLAPLVAQGSQDTTSFYKALELESAGKYKEAAPLFRTALNTSSAVNALLGLERVYAELGWSDSLLAPLDTLIGANPKGETYRTVQLRTLQSLGKDAQLRATFDRWTRDMPSSVTPYREYARLLLQKNRASAADSILARARQ